MNLSRAGSGDKCRLGTGSSAPPGRFQSSEIDAFFFSGSPSYEDWYVHMQRQVAEPIGESRFFMDVYIDVAERVGVLDKFNEILNEYYSITDENLKIKPGEKLNWAQIGERVMLVEFGSGSSTKTQVLLENLIEPAAYVPLDISEEHLLNTAEGLRQQFPDIEILPLVTDFTKTFELPKSKTEPSHCAVYFPGSTIGNFQPMEAKQLLQDIADLLGSDGGLLIGIDLQKDPAVIRAAYNDELGVTAEFNLNLLRRINSELGADFDVDQFEHLAIYNEKQGRMEIYLVSCCEQVSKLTVTVLRLPMARRFLRNTLTSTRSKASANWPPLLDSRFTSTGQTRTVFSQSCIWCYRMKKRSKGYQMAKAIWNGVVIAESDNTEMVEGNHYFPPESINQDYFRNCDTTTVCPWKGTANYYDIVVDGNTNAGAAWYYADPKPEAANIKGRIAFWKGVEVAG